MANYRPPGIVGGDHATRGARRHPGAGPPGSSSPLPGRQNDPTPADVERKLINEVGLDLLQLALDLVGIVEPTPVADGTNALISIARGNWLDAVLSGVSIVPYLGDLAKAGKLPRYLRTVEKAILLANRSPEAAKLLLPAMRKLQKALHLFPEGAPESIRRMRVLVDRFVTARTAKAVAKVLPDISRHFFFSKAIRTHTGNFERYATGQLGVPGKVKRHRNKYQQRKLSRGSGDDAGHLIGDRFGAPGGPDNLSLQNWRTNEGGTFAKLEDEWAEQLHQGTGIKVTVTDVFRKEDVNLTRPFMRRAEWTETALDGKVTVHRRIFSNPHTPESQLAQKVPFKVDSPQSGNVYDLKTKQRLGE